MPARAAQYVATAAPRYEAQARWRTIDFISDLHLQPGEPATFDLWRDYMQRTPAHALVILGDLFEVWPGDDVVANAQAPGFEACCADVLTATSKRMDLLFMHGNRDFLLGPAFASRCGMALLEDPCVLAFAGQRWLLSHGDALCLDDLDYQRFRAQVRAAPWQQTFLAQPLERRLAQARALREFSEAQKSSQRASGKAPVDLDPGATRELLRASKATTLIHGHTHRPGQHNLGDGLSRVVLADWDAAAVPPRGDVLRLSADAPPGCALSRLPAPG